MLTSSQRLLHLRTYAISNLKKSTSGDTSLYSGSKTGSFLQDEPKLGNQYDDDPLLKWYLRDKFPREISNEINADLSTFGNEVSTTILSHHNNVCSFEPELQQYDAWGKRIDKLILHPSWTALHDIVAKEGLVSIPYQNKYEEWSRVYQAMKLYLFNPSSGLCSCPLAMTDGAAAILKNHSTLPFCDAFKRLTTNNAERFWTSGQWMTEKQGGSDVGNSTETLAVKQANGTYKLYGYKWFTSATDANMSLTLARIVGSGNSISQGTKGLTMFYLETKNPNGNFNNIQIENLKKKLGTRQMPTAELILDGTIAHKISDEGRGIASISPMLSVTRIHNSITAVSFMRRLLNLSCDFSKKRVTFGTKLCHNPLHVQTLARMEVEQQASFFLLMKVCVLFGLQDNNKATDVEKLLLRVLTPLLKLYTAKQAVALATEALESFGGHGYLEDTGIPVYLRDSQVLSIWEGTTNVLSLDVIRSIQKTDGEALAVLLSDAKDRIAVVCNSPNDLKQTRNRISHSLSSLAHFLETFGKQDEAYFLSCARDLSFSLARVYIAALLYEEATRCDRLTNIARRWALSQDLAPVVSGEEIGAYKSMVTDQNIVYGNDTSCDI